VPVPSTSTEQQAQALMQRHLLEASPLPCSDRAAYALASLCVASYEKSMVAKTPAPSVRSREQTLATIRGRLDKPFRKLGWRVPDAESITLIDHSYQSETDVRLASNSRVTPRFGVEGAPEAIPAIYLSAVRAYVIWR
jgi:hypothetical protein